MHRRPPNCTRTTHLFLIATFIRSSVALRLSATASTLAAGECGRTVPAPGVATETIVASDRRTLRIRPVVPPRAGRRWALVIEGLTPEAIGRANVRTPGNNAPTVWRTLRETKKTQSHNKQQHN